MGLNSNCPEPHTEKLTISNQEWYEPTKLSQTSRNEFQNADQRMNLSALFRRLIVLTATCATFTGYGQLAPKITQQPTDQAVLVGSNVVLTVVASGSGLLSYQWRLNGTNLPKNIITVAGSGTRGSAGDGGLALAADLNYPFGICVDVPGNLFIADYSNSRIRKVDTNGIISTVAGGGTPDTNNTGFAGDGGPGTNAQLNLPTCVAFDNGGNMFICDGYNNRIRKLAPDGTISTAVGGGMLWGDNIAATNCTLTLPIYVAFDQQNNMFIADATDSRIRKVDTNGIITTVAGNGVIAFGGDGGFATNASLMEPSAILPTSSGDLLISDWGSDRIRIITSDGLIQTFVGNGLGSPGSGSYSGDGGAATNAGLYSPAGLAVEPSGSFLIADSENNAIREVDTNGIITTAVGTALNAGLSKPLGVAVDPVGNIFIADSYNHRIREVPVQGATYSMNNLAGTNSGDYDVVITSPYGSITSQVATLTVLLPPSITSQPISRTVAVTKSTSFSVSCGGTSPFSYQWLFNSSPLAGATSNVLAFSFVDATNAGNYQVIVTNLYGSTTSTVAKLTVTLPPTITLQPMGSTNALGGTMTFSVGYTGTPPFTCRWRLNGTNLPIGVISTIAGSGPSYPSSGSYNGDGGRATNARLCNPYGIALDGKGRILIADTSNYRVRMVDTNGLISTLAGSGTRGYSGDGSWATNAYLSQPVGLAIDPAGGFLFADQGNHRIRKVTMDGMINIIAGSGPYYPALGGFGGDGGFATNARLYQPKGVCVGSAGSIFIADTGNNRLRAIGTDGLISTFSGNGTRGDAGDAGPASGAQLSQPSHVAFDAWGNMFIADTENHCIRKVDTNGIISTVVGIGLALYRGDGDLATNAALSYPSAVAVDLFGNLLIADSGNSVVRIVLTNGIISTLVGKSTGFFGDGGIATSAKLATAACIAVDSDSDTLYIADTFNHRVRKVVSYRELADPTHLTLRNLQYTSAGTYDIVVSNLYGSVTSIVAKVSVILPPQQLTAQLGAGSGLQLHFSGTPGYPYAILSSTNLAAGQAWHPVDTNVADASGYCTIVDTNLTTPARFYRAIVP